MRLNVDMQPFRIFVLNRVSILSLCLKQGMFSWQISYTRYSFGLNASERVSIVNFCLEQGQGLRGRAATPHSRIYQVTPGDVILTKVYSYINIPLHPLQAHDIR